MHVKMALKQEKELRCVSGKTSGFMLLAGLVVCVPHGTFSAAFSHGGLCCSSQGVSALHLFTVTNLRHPAGSLAEDEEYFRSYRAAILLQQHMRHK